MAKSKKGKKRKKSEPLEWQTKYKIARRLLKDRSKEEVIADAIAYFLEEGEEMPGVHIIGRWRNPENKNPKHRNWKTSDDSGQSLQGYFDTIIQRVGGLDRMGGGAGRKAGRSRPTGRPVGKPQAAPRRKTKTPQKPSRSAPMVAYHKAVKAIQKGNPELNYRQARAAYRAGGKRK